MFSFVLTNIMHRICFTATEYARDKRAFFACYE